MDSSSLDDIHIRSFIASLKTKTKNYEVTNHALVTRRSHTGHVHEAEQLVESKLDIVHRDSYQAVELPNSRLVRLGHEEGSSLHVSDTSEDRFARENNNLVDIQLDTTLAVHSSDTNIGLESNRTARLADLEHTLFNLFRDRCCLLECRHTIN